MKHVFSLIFSGLLFSLFLSGCSPTETVPADNPAIRGSITSQNAGPAGGMVGSIVVEGQIEPDTSFDKAAITVTAKTNIFEPVGTERRPATFAALQPGQTIEAWFDGPVAESYPVQAIASDIVVLK